MRSPAWLLLTALLLLAIPASAAPGHGAVPSEETMYIHLLSDRLALQPTPPTGAQLQTVALAPVTCGSSLRWQAGFTQGVPDASGNAPIIPQLARNASFDASTAPSVTFYVESVRPGSEDPFPLPLTGANATVALRTGDDLSAWQDGQLLAEAALPVTLTAVAAGDRMVYAFNTRPGWQVTDLQPGETLQLEVELRFGNPTCELAWPTLRAYSAEGLRPRIVWRIYDPVRIESITADPGASGALINVVAASPWGPSRIAPIETPKIAGSSGPATGVALQQYVADGIVRATWDWQKGSAPNGTYRADVVVTTPQEDFTVQDFVLFQVGGQRNVTATPTPTPTKDSPGPGALLTVGILAAAFALRRR